MNKSGINQCIITVTRNCNLRCKFCYAKETGYIEQELIAFNDIKKIVDFCNEAKVNFIVLTGGEPTLHPDVMNIIKYINNSEHKMMATIATNGIKLSDYNFCKEMIDNGIGYVDISLKGRNEKACTEITGKDCFSKQMEAIHNLSQLPVEFTCSMVLSHENIDTFCDGIEVAYENGARQFSFTFALDNKESKIKDIEYLKQNNPFMLIEAFVSQIDRLNEVTRGEWWVEYTFPLCIYTKAQMKLLEGRLASPCHIFKRNGITLDSKMNLLPCGMHIDKKMGQFGKDFTSYEEFESYTECKTYKSTLDSLSKIPAKECNTCKYYEGCYGGCSIFWKNCSFDALREFKAYSGYKVEDF